MSAAVTFSGSLAPDESGVRRVRFHALGTGCAILFRHADDAVARAFVGEALRWLGCFEAKFSRFQPDSVVSRINACAGRDWVEVDEETTMMLDLAGRMHDLTGGILDPAILPLLRLWDWKTVHLKLPDAREVDHAMALCGWRKVLREPGRVFLPHEGMGLDFGGFGKEFAVDRVVAIARACGIRDAMVDLGRDLFAMGGNGRHPFWHVGIQDALREGECIGGLAVSDQAVCSSGSYARRFEHQGVGYGHILDPRTGWPVRHELAGVTVLAPDCLMAGIHATAVFVMGRREGRRFADCARGVHVCLQDEHGIDRSPGFIRHQVRAA